MAELSMQSRLTESSRGALDWALAYAETRGSAQIEPLDLWVGVLKTHGNDSPPVVMLSHFDIPLDRFTFHLTYDPAFPLRPPSGRQTALQALDPEAMKTLEMAVSLGEQFNGREGGLVRLRDLFGALLRMPSPQVRAYRQVLEEASVPSDSVLKAYQEYLGNPQASLKRFLDERFPKSPPAVEQQVDPSQQSPQQVVVPPTTNEQPEVIPPPGNGTAQDGSADLTLQMAVSGFSADTRAQKDLVGIGAEVDAFAYLMSARALRPPLAIGLFGDWGSGKTYFMQSLKERIFKITKDARESGKPQKALSVYKYIVQIEFNAWHYVEGELWASLVENILHNLQTRTGESPSLLQQRQQRLIEEMNKKRRDQSLASEQKAGLEVDLAQKQGEIERLKSEQEQKLRELDELKAKDVLEAVKLDPQESRQLEQVLKDMGVSGAYKSALDFMEALEQLKGELDRGSALTLVLRRRGLPWTLGLAGVILAGPLVSIAIALLGDNQVPAVTNAALSFSAALSGLTVLLRAGTNEIASLRQRVEAAQERLEQRRRQEESRFAGQIEALERELKQTSEEYQQALEQEQVLAGQIEALEQELSQITPRRVLLDFISERVESQDYRKWLGVPALIRRDFNQLSELVQDQNKAFLENDKGEEELNPDQINRIVLYIDDLDRCPPRRVAEVLQAVHLLLAFPLFVVVVAVDSRWLSQSLQNHYGGLLSPDTGTTPNGGSVRATPQDYLEKIFQIPFWVSPLGDQARLRIIQGLVSGSLVEGDGSQEQDHLETADGVQSDGHSETDLDKPTGEVPANPVIEWDADEPVREYDPQAETDPNPPGLDILDLELKFMQDLRALLGETPRSVKRFVNVYWLMKSIALSRADEFINDEPFAGFKQVQFLLAILTGMPALAHELFGLLLSDESPEKGTRKVGIQKVEVVLSPDDVLESCLELVRNRLTRRRGRGENVETALSELERLKTWLETYGEGRSEAAGSWLKLPASALKEWAPMAARFSYRME